MKSFLSHQDFAFDVPKIINYSFLKIVVSFGYYSQYEMTKRDNYL